MLKLEALSMTQRDLKRLDIISKVSDRRLHQKEAGESLGLSERQIRRLKVRYEFSGAQGLIHGLRGRSSKRRRSQQDIDEIVKLYKKDYYDFGPTFASEKLHERDKISVSKESLRQLLIRNGLWSKKRNRKKHRKKRERRAHSGELLQMDGSHHDWLEGRGPKMVLMGYVDDATGKNYGQFYEYEGTLPAMDSLRKYIKRYGLPESIYFDRHSTYKNNNTKPSIEDELLGREALSQFSRALEELGIKFIYAHSPQAKGRVERSFLTHQDRLVKEMRLAKVDTIEEANKFLESYYLPRHNKKFEIEPLNEINRHCLT